MKKLIRISLVCLTISSCTQNGDKLVGEWKSTKDNMVLTVSKNKLWFTYNISSSDNSGYINQTCNQIVLYSNSGFNCFKFPDKTARIIYQPGLKPESDLLIASNIYESSDDYFIRSENYHAKSD